MIKDTKLKVGQFNLQAGRGTTDNYSQYITEFWKNFLPFNQRHIKLAGEFIGDNNLDIICLNEIDGGSLRSKKINQVELISKTSKLPFMCIKKHILYLGD